MDQSLERAKREGEGKRKEKKERKKEKGKEDKRGKNHGARGDGGRGCDGIEEGWKGDREDCKVKGRMVEEENRVRGMMISSISSGNEDT